MKLRNGKAGENTIDRSIIKRISGAGLRKGRATMSADPVALKVRAIGELAVYAAVNAISAEMIFLICMPLQIIDCFKYSILFLLLQEIYRTDMFKKRTKWRIKPAQNGKIRTDKSEREVKK